MKILAIDGNSIMNRAFYGIRLLSNKDGVYTNAIFGFMNILLKLRDEFSPDKIAVAFDLKAPTFRHKEYADYKAGRKPMPDELRPQFPLIKQILRELGCAVLELEGYEADDILGTLSEIYSGDSNSCVIATGDRDALQLVTDDVNVVLTATKAGRPETTVYTPKAVLEKYSVTPPELIDVKALMGDSSDNIPGVAGIGEKTACKLISQYHSLDKIYNDVDALDFTKSVKEKLKNGKDNAYLSRYLGTICKSVPVNRDEIENATADLQALKSTLISLEMFKIADRLNLDDVKAETVVSPKTCDITVVEDDGADISNCAVVVENGVLCAKSDDVAYIVTENIGEALEKSKNITVFDSKRIYHETALNMMPENICDILLCAYLIDPDQSEYTLDRLSTKYNIRKNTFTCEYSDLIAKADMIENLKPVLLDVIDENGQCDLLSDIEIPLSYTLYTMERDGVAVDKQGIEEFSVKLETEIADLQQKVYDIVGEEFNLNSPKQLGVALFEKLGLPHGKKTKTGYSTSADVLENLRYDYPVVDYLLRYRTVSKLKSTYCDGLLKVICDDGRVRSTFKQTETRTGRLSSTEPNIQNIPVRTPLGRQMRKFFKAKEGYVLVDADYSQIELRVLAHIANDEIMKRAFSSETDIHTVTASQVFGVFEEMVTPELRSRAKAVNFGIVYGIGAFSLSKDIGVPVAEAKRYIEGYLATYNGVDKYMKKVVEDAKKTGFVTTVFGRRRYLPELAMSNHNMRAFGERVARNMPIQGTAADIIKIAMNKVAARLQSENLKARLILQVHDELICEAPEDERETVERILKEEMESAVTFSVPLTVEVKSGKTWYDTK